MCTNHTFDRSGAMCNGRLYGLALFSISFRFDCEMRSAHGDGSTPCVLLNETQRSRQLLNDSLSVLALSMNWTVNEHIHAVHRVFRSTHCAVLADSLVRLSCFSLLLDHLSSCVSRFEHQIHTPTTNLIRCRLSARQIKWFVRRVSSPGTW